MSPYPQEIAPADSSREGHDSIESLREAYKDKITDLRQKASTVATPEEAQAGESQHRQPFAPPPPPSAQSAQAQAISSASAADKNPIKPLSSFVDVDKILDLPPKEIEALWRLRHVKNPASICATIPIETYSRIAAAARRNPQFILPLPRQGTQQAESAEGDANANASSGADIHFLQWAFHPPASDPPPPSPAESDSTTHNVHTSTVIFTHLAAYKSHGAYATPHTTLTHHLDLADDKGLVLMHGQVMPDAGVSSAEASWLANCVQRFYDFGGQADGKKGELVRMFTRGDVQNFKVEDLLAEAERL